MGRKKLDNRIRGEKLFNKYADDLHLRGKSKVEQSKILVSRGDELQGEICSCSDSIKIDNIDAIKGSGLNINKGDFLKLVQKGVQSKYRSFSEKTIERIKDELSHDMFMNNLAASIVDDNFVGGKNDISVPDEGTIVTNAEYNVNDDFKELFDASVETRHYINSVLYKEMNELKIVFEYIWDGEYTGADFKTLVDDIHYASGGYPSPNTPPRTQSKIENFIKTFKAFGATDNIEYINDYCRKFGFEVTLISDED